jgi:hypothetical protein
MKYTVQIASDDLIYVPSFINIGSGILKLLDGRIDTQITRLIS